MTLKNATANLAHGGGKTDIALPPGTVLDAATAARSSSTPRISSSRSRPLRDRPGRGHDVRRHCTPNGVADQPHRRGIIWVPDYLVSAGGVISAVARELHGARHAEAADRVRGIGAVAETTARVTPLRTRTEPLMMS